jgi:hypothetical protein
MKKIILASIGVLVAFTIAYGWSPFGGGGGGTARLTSFTNAVAGLTGDPVNVQTAIEALKTEMGLLEAGGLVDLDDLPLDDTDNNLIDSDILQDIDPDQLVGDSVDNNKVDAGIINFNSTLVSTSNTLGVNPDLSVTSVAATGAAGIVLGVAGSVQGNIKIYSNSAGNVFYGSIFGANYTENVGFRMPASMPAVSGLWTVAANGNSTFTSPDTFQAADADLTSWAAITPSVNGGSLVAAADYATMRQLLGVRPGTEVQEYNATLAAVAAATYAGDDSIATVGTITAGVWHGTVIDGDYLNFLSIDTTISDRAEEDYIAIWDSTGEKMTKMTVGNFVTGLGGAGGSMVLDLADNGVNESTALGEIATNGDTNAIFTEPTADKLYIDLSKDWPKADVADTASTGDSATAFFSSGTIELARGGTGASLSDPNADSFMFWDDSDAATEYGTFSSSFSLNSSTNALSIVDASTTVKGIASFNTNHFSDSSGAISLVTDGIDDTLIDWGTGANQVSLDDVTDGSSYEKVAAADVASGHITILTDTDATGSITITGLSTARAITLVDADQTLANLASDQTFTGSLSVGNADTDTLTIRSLLIGGNSRALQIAASLATPTYATTTDDLYVAGTIEVAGTVYANAFITTATGGGFFSLNNFSAGRDAVAGQYALWFETDSTDQLKYSINGTEKAVVNVQDVQTITGAKTLSGATAISNVLTLSNTTSASQIIMTEASGGGSATVTIQTPNIASSYSLTLPTTDGDANQALLTNGSGVLSWGTVTATAHGSDTFVQFNDGGTALGSDSGFHYNKTTNALTLGAADQDGSLVLFNETGATDYAVTIQPGTQTGDATLTLPGATATLATLGLSETFSGTKTFSAAPIPSAATIDLGTTAAEWRNLYLTDGGILYLGADQDVTLTHVADTGVRLNAAMQLQFRDTAIHIESADDGHLDLTADTSIDLNGAVVATGTVGVATSLNPDASDGATLGTTALEWSDLYLADGGVIYGQANQGNTLTSSATGWVMNLDLTVTGNDIMLGVDGSGGVKISSDGDGAITFLGAGAGADESLTINLDDTTDSIVVSSGSGATQIDFSALNLVTTGAIHGGVEIIADDTSLSAAQCYGSVNNTNGAETITLPAAVVGMNVLIYSNDATVKNVDPNGTDTIILTTAALTAGYQIKSPGAAGDFIALVCMTANQWTCMGRSGTWVTHGAD